MKFLIDAGAELLSVNADGNMPYDLCEDDTTLSYIENEMARRGVTQDLIDETRSQTERHMLSDLVAWQVLLIINEICEISIVANHIWLIKRNWKKKFKFKIMYEFTFH